MIAGLPYKAWKDGLIEERRKARESVFTINNLNPKKKDKQKQLFKKLLGRIGRDFNIETPFRCDYGYNIEIGENFYSNFNCTILDVGKVLIGNNVMFGPNVSLYTAGHPIHPETRNSGIEYGIQIRIADNVWLGGNVVVNPGVTIGENSVIGSGSVVTKDIPPNVVAAGNPCRIVREITDEDKNRYFKNKEITDLQGE